MTHEQVFYFFLAIVISFLTGAAAWHQFLKYAKERYKRQRREEFLRRHRGIAAMYRNRAYAARRLDNEEGWR